MRVFYTYFYVPIPTYSFLMYRYRRSAVNRGLPKMFFIL